MFRFRFGTDYSVTYDGWYIDYVLVSAPEGNPEDIPTLSEWGMLIMGLLLLGMGGRLHVRAPWWRWGRSQWIAFAGLWPWLLLWGMPASTVATGASLTRPPSVEMRTG